MQQEPTIAHQPGDGYQPELKPASPKREGWKSVISTLLILIAAPLIAVLLTAYVFQSYEVDGPSMERTLQNRDRLIVLKTGKTWARLTGNDYIPKRGEIVVFEKQDSLSATDEGERQLIKRVIALPGERVVIKDGTVTVYNDEFPQGFNPDNNPEYSSNVATTTPGNVDITVPSGEIFVCGDNRTNSHDSRSFGTVSTHDLIGSLVLRIYPFSKFERF
jgi:signal peptidase I